MINAFKVFCRDPDVGHWDIWDNNGRIFKIRGEPRDYVVMDERERRFLVTKFPTVAECMAFICRDLMGT